MTEPIIHKFDQFSGRVSPKKPTLMIADGASNVRGELHAMVYSMLMNIAAMLEMQAEYDGQQQRYRFSLLHSKANQK